MLVRALVLCEYFISCGIGGVDVALGNAYCGYCPKKASLGTLVLGGGTPAMYTSKCTLQRLRETGFTKHAHRRYIRHAGDKKAVRAAVYHEAFVAVPVIYLGHRSCKLTV
jgi:hypothetical protein